MTHPATTLDYLARLAHVQYGHEGEQLVIQIATAPETCGRAELEGGRQMLGELLPYLDEDDVTANELWRELEAELTARDDGAA